MKNVLGTQENLTLYDKNGEIAYTFYINSKGSIMSVKNKDGYSCYKIYDNLDRVTSFQNSDGESWIRIYNKVGTYKQIDL